MANNIVSDDLGMQGARASVAMVLTQSFQDILVSAPEKLCLTKFQYKYINIYIHINLQQQMRSNIFRT